MLKLVNLQKLGRNCAAAALLIGLGLSANSVSQVSAQPDLAAVETVRFSNSIEATGPVVDEVHQALATFIRGMAEADAETVWMFASEEDQAAFQTEDAVLEAFADAFPALTQVEDVTFESFRNEGDTPFVVLSLTDEAGNTYEADAGMWLDDAGDWKLVSLDIVPATDRVASL